MCIKMGTKTISIMDDVYGMLVARKRASESFSELLRRSVKEKSDIMEFAGAWKDVRDGRIEEMKKDIKKVKIKSSEELKKRIERLHGDLS
jgi:predicted CopG family antitoxin